MQVHARLSPEGKGRWDGPSAQTGPTYKEPGMLSSIQMSRALSDLFTNCIGYKLFE